jgi:dTDP-4-dehydrorhamnose reductase
MITGSQGQLGSCAVQQLFEDGAEEVVAAYDRNALDLGDFGQIRAIFAKFSAGELDVVLNAAAHTAVDQCEREHEIALRINGEAPGVLAEACEASGCRLAHVSTDYVFDGRGTQPYREDDPTGPNTTYGASKLEGERRVLAASPASLIVRTAWVFGPGKNFVKAILRQARLRRSGEVEGPLRVVDDQVGCPTYADDLASGIIGLVRAGASGLYHLSNSETASWWDFARTILDRTGFSDLEIERIKTADLNLPASRPPYSVLDCGRAADEGIVMRSWREALDAYLDSPDGQSAQSTQASE